MNARKVAVVGYDRGRIDCERACRLDCVSKPKAERSAQSRGIFRDVDVEADRLPGFQNRTITPRERMIARLEGAGQHLGDRDRRYGKAQPTRGMRFEQRPESWAEFRIAFEEIDDRRRIDQNHRLFRQIIELQRFHSSRSLRIVRALSLPHSPRPDPSRGVSGCCRTVAPYAATGTNAATARPCLVMIVERPFSAASSRSGS